MTVWDFPMPDWRTEGTEVWVGAIRLRTEAMNHHEDQRWIKAVLADLEGPSIYEQLCVERGIVPCP